MGRRGDIAVIRRVPSTPPEGIPSEGMVLMVHIGKGYRWIPLELKERKLKIGYGYVRDYNPTDDIILTEVRPEAMTPEQLLDYAEKMKELAEHKLTNKTPPTSTEKAYLAKKAKDDAEEAERLSRAEQMGLVKSKGKVR